jgi:16S rRNA (adenine1518-N6/adenine1519-N6)-dimethyltransferase
MARAKRSLSQNFLVDPNIRRKIVAELGAGLEDHVLEIGPGHGELSDLMVGKVARLVLIEKDDRLATELDARFADRRDVRVEHADALEIDLSALQGGEAGLLISNLPYGITSPLIFRFLDMEPLPRRMVLLVQSEVAERIAAVEGSKTYGALTVGVQVRARVRMAFRVGRRAFRPIPAVDSAVIILEPRPGSPAGAGLEELRTLTRVAFSRRRKQLGRILRSAPEYDLPGERVREILSDLGVAPEARPETLSPEQFVSLADRLLEVRGTPHTAPPATS